MSEGRDAKACIDAADSVLMYIDELEVRKSLNLQEWLLKAVASLTREMAEQDVKYEKIQFEPTDLLDWLNQHGEGVKSTEQSPSGYVAGYYNKLLKKYESNCRIEGIAAEHGLSHFGRPGKIEGGGTRKRNLYRLEIIPLTEASIQEALALNEIDVPDRGLRYVEQEKKKAPWLVSWLNGVDLVGWKLLVLLTVILFPLLNVLLFLSTPAIVLFWPEAGLWLRSVMFWPVFLSAVIYGLFGFLYRLVDKRVAMAPAWVSISGDYWLFEYRPVRDGKGGYKHRRMALVLYRSGCPVCQKGVVTVHSGGWMFPGRLVGKCDENPVEHVFSFDHVTRVGKPLR